MRLLYRLFANDYQLVADDVDSVWSFDADADGIRANSYDDQLNVITDQDPFARFSRKY